MSGDLDLIAHLMRRAGFGTTPEELEEMAAKGYETVVEDLLHPERCPDIEEDVLERYYSAESLDYSWLARWTYRMINTRRPLEEKMALFYHHVFATGRSKVMHPPSSIRQIEMFRRVGLSDLQTILTELSRDPAMIFWLDNNENHKGAPNENYGRELLELFSMGVGNYTEQDIKEAARAFTGWTFVQPIPLYTQGYYPSEFEFVPEDHDDGIKTFLGETGNLDGEDIIDIIVKQPATARFIARHLYNFFVADEAQVPAWNTVPPQDPEAIDTLVRAYMESGGEMRSILRVLFNSDFFKNARFKKVKSPTELVIGIVRLAGTYKSPEPGIEFYPDAISLMGQQLLNPPTVEGWHTGKEWIDGGTLSERVNFAVDELADPSKPGIQGIINRLSANDGLSPEEFVESCLSLTGRLVYEDDDRQPLLQYAHSCGSLKFGTPEDSKESASRIVRMLQLIVSSREYQFA